MKKLLGLIALTVVSSSFLLADNAKEQDFFERIEFKSEYRKNYKDYLDSDREGQGSQASHNGGPKGANNYEDQWRNTLSGTLNLNDEWGLKADFKIYRKDIYSGTKKSQEEAVLGGRPAQRWDTDSAGNIEYLGTRKIKHQYETVLTLRKAVEFNNWFTGELVGEWEYFEGPFAVNNGDVTKKGMNTNVFRFGPKFDFNFFGQTINTKVYGVYFRDNGYGESDYWKERYGLKSEGYGMDVDFQFNGPIYDGTFGRLGYNVELENHLRIPSNKDDNNNDAFYKNSWKLKYFTALGYTTPSFYGFYAGIDLENEWIKHTGGQVDAAGNRLKNGYTNEFSVIPQIGYKTSFDTPVGNLQVNPFVKYVAINKLTEQGSFLEEDKNHDNKSWTTETNSLRGGISLKLSVD